VGHRGACRRNARLRPVQPGRTRAAGDVRDHLGHRPELPRPRGLRITGSLEHTAPLLPGSSGGPVLDAAGHLLGINTNRLGEGFYLAIPADEELRRRVDALGRGESVRPPQLGITITPGHVARRLRRAVGLPDAEGLLIRDVAEDSPAARAGLASGDLIVRAAGQPVRSVDDLSGALRAAAGTIELTVLRWHR
jgi:serine protease Do